MVRQIITARYHPVLVVASAVTATLLASIAYSYKAPLVFDLSWIVAVGSVMRGIFKASRLLAAFSLVILCAPIAAQGSALPEVPLGVTFVAVLVIARVEAKCALLKGDA
jgi:hypothetical protein